MSNFKRILIFTIVLAVIFTVAGLAACQPVKEVAAPTSTPEASPPTVNTPDIQGVSARILTDNNNMLTNNVNFDIISPGFSPLWTGDVIYYLDVNLQQMTSQSATVTGNNSVSSVSDFYTWNGLQPGMHTFAAQLVTPDLKFLTPNVYAGIQMDVPPTGTSAPLISEVSVQILCRPGYTVPGTSGRPTVTGTPSCADINMALSTRNFTVSTITSGQPASAGQGHFIYYFNVDPPTTPGEQALTEDGTYAITSDSVASWVSVMPGEYQVWAQLVNNDNTPLNPPVIAGSTIMVPIDAGRYLGY